MWNALLLLSVLGVARGQPAPEAPVSPAPEERELAVPPERPPPPPVRAEGRPLAVPAEGITPQLAQAMRAYRAQHLQVRSLTEFHVISRGIDPYWPRFGRWGMGWGGPMWTPPAVMRVDTWAIYQGPRRLEVPEYLHTVSQQEDLQALMSRIRLNRGISTGFYVGAAGGAAALVVGMIQMNAATGQDELQSARLVATAGMFGVIGGLVGGSIPGARARRLRLYPGATRSLEQVQQEVGAHNEALRQQLGLTPGQALALED